MLLQVIYEMLLVCIVLGIQPLLRKLLLGGASDPFRPPPVDRLQQESVRYITQQRRRHEA